MTYAPRMESHYYARVDGIPDADEDADTYEYFTPTSATLSVWSPDIQHGGPPAGLLMRALLRTASDTSQHFTRVTTEILGPIGLGLNRVRARILRPGKQITLLGADLEVQQRDGSFRLTAQSIGWRMRTADTATVARSPHPALPAPETLPITTGISVDTGPGVDWGTVGFIGTTETAATDGRHGETPAVWIRPAIPLVEGETMSNLESVFTVLDVANGLGSTLRPDRWTWMNTDTTIHLVAPPTSPWLGIDADLVTGRHGFGATFADLYDVSGYLGRSAQTVLLEARSGG